MSSQEALIQIINEAPLSETTRNFFAKKVEREGATEENIIALRELLRTVQHTSFAGLGLTIDENNPEIKQAQQTFAADVKVATDKFEQTMSRLEQQANRLASDIQEDLQHLENIVVQSAKAEA